MKALSVLQFRNYLLGAFVSEIGNQMQIVAVAWQIYEMTRNPAALGFIGIANFLPIILFSLFGGLVADKVNRKKLLTIVYSIQATIVFVLFTLSWTQSLNPPIIYLILVLLSTFQSFSIPARQAILPHLVPKPMFMNAVSLHTLQFQSATMIGPAIAGILIAGFGVSSVYFFNAVSFLFYVGIVLFLKIPPPSNEVEFTLSSIKEGINFVIKTPILYTTMILDFLATFLGTATILMPIFAKDVLHVGATGLGLLYSAPAIGGILAGVLMSFIHKLGNQGKMIIVSIILYGLAIIGFGLSKVFVISVFFLILMGFGDMVSTVIRNTIRQVITPDHLRGRMGSIMRMFFQGGPQLGEIEAGFLAKAIGGPATVVVGGIGVVVITAIIALKNKSLRNYQGKEVTV